MLKSKTPEQQRIEQEDMRRAIEAYRGPVTVVPQGARGPGIDDQLNPWGPKRQRAPIVSRSEKKPRSSPDDVGVPTS
jgi:hypothetical protein